MERVYSLDPSPDSLSVVAKKHIIGAQANIWTEYIAYKNLLEYQMLPRAAAMSEVQWVMPKQKNYGDFLERERQMLNIYQLYNYTYCPAEFNKRKQ
jgi:hexosaminidase